VPAVQLAHLLAGFERDSVAVSASVKVLLDSIQSYLSQSLECTSEHMETYAQISQLHSTASLEAVRHCSGLIGACVELNKEMSHIEPLAAQIKQMRRALEQLELQASRVL